MRKLKFFCVGLFLALCFVVPTKSNAKPDDCQVAYEIAYENAFQFCMATIGEEGTCKYQARNEANRHAVDIGCPPQN